MVIEQDMKLTSAGPLWRRKQSAASVYFNVAPGQRILGAFIT